jgi:uncharacterized membrane protein YfcA
MQILIGFMIALCVGMTGVGGGSFTAPALVLIVGLSGAEAVGTALVYSLVIRIVAAPFYVAGKHVHFRYLWLMLLGGLPGLLAGTYLLATLNTKRWNHVVLVMIGVTLICSSVLTFVYRKATRPSQQRSARWLPWFTFPIGIETGFSSAGAGALGTILLFNYSDMPSSQVVGTDLLFGIALAAGGTLFHFSLGSISTSSLKELLIGGIPGVLLGCILAPRVPSIRLKPLVIGLTLILGLQLVWNGVRVWP